jgi:hypothetical protein
VTFLFDSGAKPSLISVAAAGLMETGSKSQFVNGIGGKQAVGDVVSCNFTFDCESGPSEHFTHDFKPTSIPGEKAFVLLGIDFLAKFKKTVFAWDENKVKLGDNWIYFVSGEKPDKNPRFDISNKLSQQQYSTLHEQVTRFADVVFAHNPKAPKQAKEGMHVIETKADRPHKDKFRRCPQKWKETVTCQINEMLDNGIIVESTSPYSSNMLLVDKKDGSKRFCVDYRTLNANTVKDTYPLPNVDDILDQLRGCMFFSQLDLASGYWGIPIHPDDAQKTAFAANCGKFEFKRMPFGLCNAQATFQRCMDKIVQQVQKAGHSGIAAYVDNILVFSKSFEEHRRTLEVLFEIITRANLSLRRDKCEFAKDEIEFLGFIVNGSTVRPTPENVEKVKQFPVPKTRRQLQRFLGVANFNRKFIPNYSEVVKELSSLTSSKVKYEWGAEQQAAFNDIKERLSLAPSLYLADWNKEFHIETDASNVAVGGVLFQVDDKGARFPLAYFSKTLNKSEQGWSATEKEFFGIIAASRKWTPYCYNHVTFHTDHLPLRYIRNQKDPRGKLARWILELENLDYTIEYIKGKDNTEADYLSRIETAETSNPIVVNPSSIYFVSEPNFESIAREQDADKQIGDAKVQLKNEESVKKGIFKTYRNLSLRDSVLYKGERIVVPPSLSMLLLQEYHGQYHYGIENTLLALKKRFYWRNMRRDVEKLIESCRTCIQCKDGRSQRSVMQLPDPVGCRERLCIDIASMPKSKKGHACFLQMIDADTKFAATCALSNQLAESIRNAIWPKWFAYFGIPAAILSDQGPNIDGKIIRNLCAQLNIKKMHSSPYHPEGNGSTERSIGSVKSVLRAMCLSRGVDLSEWDTLLDEATLAYNSTVNKSTGFSPFKSMFGSDPVMPVDRALGVVPKSPSLVDPLLVQENANLNRREAQETYKNKSDLASNTSDFSVGDKVLMKRTFGPHTKMSVRWKEDVNGQPYTIMKRVGPVNYAIANSKGTAKIYHRNMLKPASVRIEPSFTASGGVPNVSSQHPSHYISVPVLGRDNLLGQSTIRSVGPSIDNQEFTQNFFSDNWRATGGQTTATSTDGPSSASRTVANGIIDTVSRPRRGVAPIERLGIENSNNGYNTE